MKEKEEDMSKPITVYIYEVTLRTQTTGMTTGLIGAIGMPQASKKAEDFRRKEQKDYDAALGVRLSVHSIKCLGERVD